jgi:predicted RNA-binding Zn-ribbon protein involved in translation (DUF1610 family)
MPENERNMPEPTNRWIDAVIRFLKEPETDVLCPSCGEANLRAMDIRLESEPGLFERIVYCPACGEKNYIRFRDKSSQ